MVDINGSLNSLISKYYLIQGTGSTELHLLEDALYKQFVDIHRWLHVLWDQPDIKDTSDGISLFDIPLIKWAIRRAIGFLAESLERKEEAALKMAQAERTKEDLPHFSKFDESKEIVVRRRFPNPPTRRSTTEIIEDEVKGALRRRKQRKASSIKGCTVSWATTS